MRMRTAELNVRACDRTCICVCICTSYHVAIYSGYIRLDVCTIFVSVSKVTVVMALLTLLTLSFLHVSALKDYMSQGCTEQVVRKTQFEYLCPVLRICAGICTVAYCTDRSSFSSELR